MTGSVATRIGWKTQIHKESDMLEPYPLSEHARLLRPRLLRVYVISMAGRSELRDAWLAGFLNFPISPQNHHIALRGSRIQAPSGRLPNESRE